MDRDQQHTGDREEGIPAQPNYESFPDVTPRREGGDDALAESSPLDSRSDEKVIVNTKRGEEKIANGQAEKAASTNDNNSGDQQPKAT